MRGQLLSKRGMQNAAFVRALSGSSASSSSSSTGANGIRAASSQQQQQQGEVVGVVVVDHGSRRAASNVMLDEFVELYRQVSGHDIVEPAHMEIAEPSIADAVARCCERGATMVVVAPYFLSRGRHIQDDIPALVAEAQAAHPGVRCTVADPIGIDPLVAQVIESRVQQALAATAPGGDGAEQQQQQQQQAVKA